MYVKKEELKRVADDTNEHDEDITQREAMKNVCRECEIDYIEVG